MDNYLREDRIKMTSEQLISFLFHRTTFFDSTGPSLQIRQFILALSVMGQGYILSRGSLDLKGQTGTKRPDVLGAQG